jgi:hypothetical protein
VKQQVDADIVENPRQDVSEFGTPKGKHSPQPDTFTPKFDHLL